MRLLGCSAPPPRPALPPRPGTGMAKARGLAGGPGSPRLPEATSAEGAAPPRGPAWCGRHFSAIRVGSVLAALPLTWPVERQTRRLKALSPLLGVAPRASLTATGRTEGRGRSTHGFQSSPSPTHCITSCGRGERGPLAGNYRDPPDRPADRPPSASVFPAAAVGEGREDMSPGPSGPGEPLQAPRRPRPGALTHRPPPPRPGSAERGPSARDASDGTLLGRGHLSSGKRRTGNGAARGRRPRDDAGAAIFPLGGKSRTDAAPPGRPMRRARAPT